MKQIWNMLVVKRSACVNGVIQAPLHNVVRVHAVKAIWTVKHAIQRCAWKEVEIFEKNSVYSLFVFAACT